MCLILLTSTALGQSAVPWPKLPEMTGSVVLQVQDDPAKPARPLTIHLSYPASWLSRVTASTGLFLDLHNWGGTKFIGAPNAEWLVRDYDVVSIGVDYYQSGDKEHPADPPYDYGYLQAMDALRALHYVYTSLHVAELPFDATRIYGAGGSGGGNVIQMCNKFAPHTFACIVDLSGMASLTDEAAFNLSGRSKLKARYSQDPKSPAFLARGMQEIRDLGHPAHLALAAKAGNRCKIVIIHGVDDPYCLYADKLRVADAMRTAGLDVEPHFIRQEDVDGTLIKNCAHSIGDRTVLLQRFAGDYFLPGNSKMRRLEQPCDFERKGEIVYPTSDGVHVISFAHGVPTLRFNKTPEK